MSKNRRKYTKELLESVILECKSVYEVMRKLGFEKISGGSHSHIGKLIKKFSIDVSHFTGQGHNKGKVSARRLSADEILVHNRSNGYKEKIAKLRRALDEIGVERKCSVCSLADEWNSKSITLEVHHKDGDPLNNVSDNLEYLCPNCHSQDKYYNKRKNKGE